MLKLLGRIGKGYFSTTSKQNTEENPVFLQKKTENLGILITESFLEGVYFNIFSTLPGASESIMLLLLLLLFAGDRVAHARIAGVRLGRPAVRLVGEDSGHLRPAALPFATTLFLITIVPLLCLSVHSVCIKMGRDAYPKYSLKINTDRPTACLKLTCIFIQENHGENARGNTEKRRGRVIPIYKERA